jgi:hypothetical protein
MIRIATKKQPKPSPSEALADLSLADDRLLKTADAAALLGLSQKTLRQLRCDRAGPRSDLERWVREHAHAVGGA